MTGGLSRFRTAVATVLLAAGLSAAAHADEPAARAALQGYIQPGFDSLAAVAADMEGAAVTLCDAPSPATLAQARAAFRETVLAWAAVEFVRFGPLTEAHRADRLHFWPDRRGVARRHVEAALAAAENDLLTAEGIAAASAAVQGLPALEILLHGAGSDDLSVPPAGYRCALAEAVSANVASLSARAAAEWRREDGFVALLLNPGPGNALFRDSGEVTARLVDIPGAALQDLQDRKLQPAIGTGPGAVRPFLAPFQRSGLTEVYLLAGLSGLDRFMAASGQAALVRARAPDRQAAVDQVLGILLAELEGLEAPLLVAAADPSLRGRVNRLALLVARLRELLRDEVPAALGMTVLFNARDGD